jgi:hypothetical protein
VSAVVVGPAPDSAAGGEDNRHQAQIHWVDPTGTARSATAAVSRVPPTGSRLLVWTDGLGALVPAPPGSDATVAPVARAAGAAALVVAATAMILVAGSAIVRHLERRRRLAGWAKEWSGLAGGPDSGGR